MKTTLASCLIASWLFTASTSFAQRTPPRPLPQEQLQTMAAMFGLISTDSVKQPDPAALMIAGVRGLVREADPEDGAYFDPKEFAKLKAGRAAEQSMEDLRLEKQDNRIVVHPMPGGSAQAAGVHDKDVLYAVDGARVANMEVHQVAALLAGPQGSTYSATVFRESSLSVQTLAIERRPPVPIRPSVTSAAPGVAVLRVLQFREETLTETALALKAAWQQSPFHRGLVLDLRGSPGGLFYTAIGLASIFLPENVLIASTKGRIPESNFQYRAAAEFYLRPGISDPLAGLPPELRSLPMVVIMDGATAAGAEIIVAALKDNRRATLVGQKTWGRGSVQTVRPLSSNDGVKFTTAYWFSPNGTRIHGLGVSPDVVIANPNSEAALQQAVAALEKSR